jgi:hypothetical protein
MKNIDDKDLVDVTGGGRSTPSLQPSQGVSGTTGQGNDELPADLTDGDDQGGTQDYEQID